MEKPFFFLIDLHPLAPVLAVSFLLLGSRRIMAHQEEGWPLGLRLLNARVGFVRNQTLSGSISLNSLLTSSSTFSSSDLDTESSGSFCHEKSITFGSLIGVSNILELSRRSGRGRSFETLEDKKKYKFKPWLLSLCSKLRTDAVILSDNAPSLAQFLEEERKATGHNRRGQTPLMAESSSLFLTHPVPSLSSAT